MDIEPIGNAVEVEAVGNRLDVKLIDIISASFFLSTLQHSLNHKEVGRIDND